MSQSSRRVGTAIVGLGGAVATTAIAGLELLRLGAVGGRRPPAGRPDRRRPAARPAPRTWSRTRPGRRRMGPGRGRPNKAAVAARRAGPPAAQRPGPQLATITAVAGRRPTPPSAATSTGGNVVGRRAAAAGSTPSAPTCAASRAEQGLERRRRGEPRLDRAPARPGDAPALADARRLRGGPRRQRPAIAPAMLYAYAAIREGVPYANFTPSLSPTSRRWSQLAEQRACRSPARTARPARR